MVFRFYADKDLEKSIAVLPFKNLGESRENQFFADGVMDDILSYLSRMKGLRVTGRTSTERFREPTQSIPEMARELHVSYIVEGTIQKYGDNFRLRVQLIRAKRKEDHIWADTYDREIRGTRDIFYIQSQIAQAIASALKVAITPEVKRFIEKIPTTSLMALEMYRKGREEYLKFQLNNDNRKSLENAERFYHQALQNDPYYAQVYAGLARVYWDMHFNKDYLLNNFQDSVLVLAEKALILDDQLSEAYYLKGVYFLERVDITMAEEMLDKSIKLNPNNWLAYFGKNEICFVKEDLLEAIENLETARTLNRNGKELPLILEKLAIRYVNAGFTEKGLSIGNEWLKQTGDSARYYYDEAQLEFVLGHHLNSVEFSKKACLLDSANILYRWQLTFYYSLTGHFKEALELIRKITPADIYAINEVHRVGYIYWGNGLKEESDRYFDKQIEICKKAIESNRSFAQGKWAYYDLAAVFAFRGDKEQAYKNLRIYNERSVITYGLLHYIKTDPLFNNLRGDSEFQQIVKEQEAKQRAEHERVRKGLEGKGLL
jgi:TolB-like protein